MHSELEEWGVHTHSELFCQTSGAPPSSQISIHTSIPSSLLLNPPFLLPSISLLPFFFPSLPSSLPTFLPSHFPFPSIIPLLPCICFLQLPSFPSFLPSFLPSISSSLPIDHPFLSLNVYASFNYPPSPFFFLSSLPSFQHFLPSLPSNTSYISYYFLRYPPPPDTSKDSRLRLSLIKGIILKF